MKYLFSSGFKSSLTQEDIDAFIDYFPTIVPESEIEFVAENLFLNESKAMYSIQHRSGQAILIFPLHNEVEGNYLFLGLEKEFPHLDGLLETLHQYGGDMPPERLE